MQKIIAQGPFLAAWVPEMQKIIAQGPSFVWVYGVLCFFDILRHFKILSDIFRLYKGSLE